MREVKVNVLVECNRCAHEDLWINETPAYMKWEWGELFIGQEDEHHKHIRFDLCPACTREIKAWIRNGR